MSARLHSIDMPIQDLLSGRFSFSIPAYQRDYAWTRDETDQLIDDMVAAIEDEERAGREIPYFLGTMLLVDVAGGSGAGGGGSTRVGSGGSTGAGGGGSTGAGGGGSTGAGSGGSTGAGSGGSTGAGSGGSAPAGPTRVEVIDGQQRLITLTIMFAVLRDLEPADDAAELQRLVALGGAGLVRDTAGDPSGDEAGTVDEAARYQLTLRPGDDTFFKAAIQSPGASRRGRPAEDLVQSHTRRQIEEVRRAIRARLQHDFTPQERARLASFARSGVRVLVVISDDFDYAYQIFLTINDRGKRLTVEDIFRGEILGPLDLEQRERYEPIIDEMDKYREAAEGTRSKGKTFFSHLATIDAWPHRAIIAGLKRAVQRRGGPRRFVAEVFAPMAESYLQVKGSAIAQPLPLQAGNWLEMLRWLEQHGDDDWAPVAMLALRRLGDDGDALAAFLKALDRYAHGLMALGCGRDARRKHYAPVLKSLIDVGAPLPDPDLLFTFSADDQKLILRNVATRLHMIDPPTAKLFLLRADLTISRQPLAYYLPLIDPGLRGPDRLTVEHLCPKGSVKGGEWARLFPRQTARVRASQCIGNLVLVTEAQNKRVNQNGFEAKKRVLFPDGAASPFYLTDMLRAEAEWDGKAIARRYGLIMDAIKSMWQLAGTVPSCPALAAGVRREAA